jgi:hypothetical protein
MTQSIGHSLRCALAVSLLAGFAAGQSAAPAKPKPSKVPAPPREQQELFLATAKVREVKPVTTGTTKTWRLTLDDGRGLVHDAHVQTIDIYRPVFRGKEGTVEKNFRDSYKFNIAAYRLDKLLGLEMIPVSVEREHEGKSGSWTWWVDDVWMDEATRRDKKVKPPAADFWVNQLNRVRVFDQLIYNTDRNQGNILITHDWQLWMIDHSRAFRTQRELMKVETLTRIDAPLLAALRGLDRKKLTAEVGAFLRTEELDALLARRDLIVKHFESEIGTKGEDAVLTDLPRKTPHVSVP